jgi:hypothetical protein
VDYAKLDLPLLTLTQHVYECLPEPPVDTAAPLSGAAMAWGPGNGVDRLSSLPDELLCNIVSRLPVKDAARTTMLSTRWTRVQHLVPLALVDARLLPCEDLTATVSSALASHPGPFGCIHLTGTPMDDRQAAGICHWLEVLASNVAESLDAHAQEDCDAERRC